MDHGGHGGMDHGGGAGSGSGSGGGMPSKMPMMCKMNMSWNYDPSRICLVFPSLQIKSADSFSFFFALLFLFVVGFLYEASRQRAAQYDREIKAILCKKIPGSKRRDSNTGIGGRTFSDGDGSESDEGLLSGSKSTVGLTRKVQVPLRMQAIRSFFYALNVAISFYLMLIVMSYNAWLILAVLVGGFVGHFVFQRNLFVADDTEAKGMACH